MQPQHENDDDRKGFAEAEPLLHRFLCGDLSGEDAARLEAMIERRPELGTWLLDQMRVDAMLREAGDDDGSQARIAALRMPRKQADHPAVEPAVSDEAALRQVRFVGWLTWVGLAAALLVAISLPIVWTPPAGPAEAEEPTTVAVAVLSGGAGLVWEEGSSAPAAGDSVAPGVLRLKSGAARIEFFQGACVVLEGPAELEIVSAGEAFCRRGRLSAEVPSYARGFKVRTPKGTVVDLGTSFGLKVDEDAAEVHVFQGEVELQSGADGDGQRLLQEGQAAALETAGRTRSLPMRPEGFITPRDFERRIVSARQKQVERWKEASRRWNLDPSLLVRFDFEPNEGGSSRELVNRAAQAADALPAAQPGDPGKRVESGTIVGCGWTEGRWPEKRAMAFRTISDRVLLEIPGKHSVFTLLAWVRIRGLDRPYNSIFMSNGWRQGAAHWQVTRDGRVRLGINHRRTHDFDAPEPLSPEQFGRWMHLAVVFDADAKEIRHYLDGRLSRRWTGVELHPMTPGRVELGNWNNSDTHHPTAVRNFSGDMDEFSFYTRPFSDAEVQEHFSLGGGESVEP